MVKNHARKNRATAVRGELDVTHGQAVAILDVPANAETRKVAGELDVTYSDAAAILADDRFEEIYDLLASTSDQMSYVEAVAFLEDPGNDTLCGVCGWTNSMVCPECPGCGCNTSCTGWRHTEYHDPNDDALDDALDDVDEDCDCGATGSADPYAECVCGDYDETPTNPATAAERFAQIDAFNKNKPSDAAALAAIHRGLTVFPLPAGGRVPEAGWRDRLCSTIEQVAATWPQDGSNVAVACGVSGVVVLDDDAVGMKRSSVGRLARELGEPVPETFIVRTPSGGRHWYFLAPAGVTIPSSSGGVTGLGPDVDVRAGGGYVLAAYSVVPDADGNPVTYIPTEPVSGPRIPIAPLPAWILERITPGG